MQKPRPITAGASLQTDVGSIVPEHGAGQTGVVAFFDGPV